MVEDAGAEGRIILNIILTCLKPSGSFACHQVILKKKLYVLPTQCIYVLCVVLGTNTSYSTIQH